MYWIECKSFKVLLISLLRWKIENISGEYLLFEVKIRLAPFDIPQRHHTLLSFPNIIEIENEKNAGEYLTFEVKIRLPQLHALLSFPNIIESRTYQIFHLSADVACFTLQAQEDPHSRVNLLFEVFPNIIESRTHHTFYLSRCVLHFSLNLFMEHKTWYRFVSDFLFR